MIGWDQLAGLVRQMPAGVWVAVGVGNAVLCCDVVGGGAAIASRRAADARLGSSRINGRAVARAS